MLFNAAITTGRTVIFNGFKSLPNIKTRKNLLSNLHRFNTTFSKVKSLKGEEIEAFKSMLPTLINELTFEGRYKDMPNVNEHLSKCIDYNLTNGKLTRGTTVALTLKLLSDDNSSKEMLNKSFILGWCVEFMQAFFLVADDIMDGSETRRGKVCWYKKENIGMKAVNDFLFLETCIFALLNKHFRDKSYYINLLDTFHEIIRHTVWGQGLDLESENKCHLTLEDFTMDRYTQIVQYKTSYYSFYLPVQLGMILAGIKDPELYRQARTILLAMGHYFQVQDDYLDCFGDPKVTGKIGTDIQDRKCSWMIVTAMQMASDFEKDVLKQNYGKLDLEAIENVKSIYNKLKLKETYAMYEDKSYNDIIDKINNFCHRSEKNATSLNDEIFLSLLSKINKRKA